MATPIMGGNGSRVLAPPATASMLESASVVFGLGGRMTWHTSAESSTTRSSAPDGTLIPCSSSTRAGSASILERRLLSLRSRLTKS